MAIGTESPQEEILVPPEFSILEFGDGYIALAQGAVERKDGEGREVVEFLIKPSNLLKKRFIIRDEDLDRNGNMLFPVLKQDLIPINLFDDSNRKWLYIKTFEHSETEISKISWSLRKGLEEANRRIMFLEGNLIWMSEQLQLAKTNPAEFASQGLEIFNKMGSTLVNLIKSKKTKEDMEE